MEELDKETRKPFTVQSVDVTITLLTCAMKQHVNKQNSSNRQGGFSGFALTATSNGYCDGLRMHEPYHPRQINVQDAFYAGGGRKFDVYY